MASLHFDQCFFFGNVLNEQTLRTRKKATVPYSAYSSKVRQNDEDTVQRCQVLVTEKYQTLF